MKNSLFDNHIGSRVMIATCNREVVDYCKKSSHVHVYKLQPLPWDKVWELFCKRAFQIDFEGHCPLVLEKLSHDIEEWRITTCNCCCRWSFVNQRQNYV